MESGPLSRFLGAGAFCEKGGEKEAPEEGGAGEGEGGGLELAAECDEDGESQDGEGEDGQNYEANDAAELSFHKLYRLIKVTKNQGVMQGINYSSLAYRNVRKKKDDANPELGHYLTTTGDKVRR